MSEHTIILPYDVRKHIYVGQALRLEITVPQGASNPPTPDRSIASLSGHVEAVIENDGTVKVVIDGEAETELKDRRE